MTQNSRGGFVRTEEQALIDTEALRLRSQGMGYREIALAQGVDTSTAHRRVSRALGEIPQTIADEYRALELSRLDALQVARHQRLQDAPDGKEDADRENQQVGEEDSEPELHRSSFSE